MGRSNRIRPARLSEKLFAIREALKLTQEQLISRLNYTDSPLYPQNISGFETGEREPNLLILLAYARLAGVCLDALVDDTQDIPEKLPSNRYHKI